MAHTKATGATKNTRDSQPKFLGVKLSDGQNAKIGAIIVRQRGTKFRPGNNVAMGRDHTIYALKKGLVRFSNKKITRFDGKSSAAKIVEITAASK